MKKENVLLVIPGVERQGGLFRRPLVYTLIITDRHIIAGKVGTIQPGRLFQGTAATSYLQKSRMNHSKYDGMETEEILTANEENYAFTYDELRQIAMKSSFFLKPFIKLVPHVGKSLNLSLPGDDFPKVKEVLTNQAPDIIKA